MAVLIHSIHSRDTITQREKRRLTAIHADRLIVGNDTGPISDDPLNSIDSKEDVNNVADHGMLDEAEGQTRGER